MNQGNLYAVSDTGLVRRNNEDRLLISGNLDSPHVFRQTGWHQAGGSTLLCVVSDGMGGENAGEVAAEIAADRIHHFLARKIKENLNSRQIRDLIRESQMLAHKAVIEHARNNPDCIGMGTTVVLALVKGNKMYLGWTGDSRAYLFRRLPDGKDQTEESTIYKNGSLELLTNDHSLVWNEVISGKLTPEQARTSPMSNVITQVLGDPLNIPKPDVREMDLAQGDLILLCSDGLSGMISDRQIHHSIDVHLSGSLEEIANDLLLQAKLAGGKDNISFVLYQYESRPGGRKTIKGNLFMKSGRVSKPFAFFILFVLFTLGLVFVFQMLGWVDLNAGLERILGPVEDAGLDSLLHHRLDSGKLKVSDSLETMPLMYDTTMSSSMDSLVHADSVKLDSSILK